MRRSPKAPTLYDGDTGIEMKAGKGASDFTEHKRNAGKVRSNTLRVDFYSFSRKKNARFTSLHIISLRFLYIYSTPWSRS